MRSTVGECAIDTCAGVVWSKGWCCAHYERWRKHGDPLAGRASTGNHKARFWAKVEANSDDCWVWTGTVKSNGYGKFSVGTRTFNAHRWAYEDMIAEIPDDLDLDHLCRNRACVNPYHLEPVTRAVNLNRGRSANREKTHCHLGHPYDLANTRIGATGGRWCRACERLRRRNAA